MEFLSPTWSGCNAGYGREITAGNYGGYRKTTVEITHSSSIAPPLFPTEAVLVCLSSNGDALGELFPFPLCWRCLVVVFDVCGCVDAFKTDVFVCVSS